MKRILVVFAFALAVAGMLAAQETIRVAAAANLASVAPELSAAYTRTKPQTRVEFVFGASGTLVTQILNGAPLDVFMSADRDFADRLVAAGATVGPVSVYAYGSLVLFSRRPLDFSKGLAVLADPSITKIAVANPETAPYGRAAMQALQAAGLADRLAPKLVYAQNITQALQFALSGADAGFIAASALSSPELAAYDHKGTNWIPVDETLHAPIAQGLVVLKASAHRDAALAFARFLSSPEAWRIFAAHGYGRP